MSILSWGPRAKKLAWTIVILFAGVIIFVFAAFFSTSDGNAAASPSASASDMTGEAMRLKYYFDTYNDMYAAMRLKELFTAGQITQNEYNGEYAATGDSISVEAAKEYKKVHKALNCLEKGLSKKDLAKDDVFLENEMKNGAAVISLFDTQDTRDRVERLVKVIGQWKASPDDAHTKAMEAGILSGDVTYGEIVFLHAYMRAACKDIPAINVDGRQYDLNGYMDGRAMGAGSGLSINDYFENASMELLLKNNAAG
jgi:hypothetical protein